jgi:phosphoribosylformylglycinamidine synthase
MSDLLSGRIDLQRFRGVVFVGGFSYADVLDSAKGWAGVIRFNQELWKQFQGFSDRPDTFSLGICNGCQLLALLGWLPWKGIPDEIQPRFVQNASDRFESRFVSVRIEKSPALMLRGMEGAVLGIWVAHGEGRAFFPEGAWPRFASRTIPATSPRPTPSTPTAHRRASPASARSTAVTWR